LTYAYQAGILCCGISVIEVVDMRGLTPGSEMELLVLAVLRSGPAHGYAITQEINRRTDGALSMKEGTLYPLLHRLEGEGLVKAAWQVSDRGPARRTYELKAKGRRALVKRANEWRRLVGVMSGALGEIADA
jgi:DNA-binding PadR family transcriptional regulator